MVLAPAVFGEPPHDDPVDLPPDLVDRFSKGPAEVYASIVRSTARVESEHDSLRASLQTIEKMQSSVDGVLRRVFNLGARASFKVAENKISKMLLQYSGSSDPRRKQHFECCCVDFRIVFEPSA